MSAFGFNVFDFGARGDGKTDDTAAIQRAIDFCAKRGGGRICFPYTVTGYRIASPGVEEYKGKPVRAQLIIPPGAHNIMLEGEMPCRLLNDYQVRPMTGTTFTPTLFGSIQNNNTFLFSDWLAPEVHDAEKRPWAILAAPEGNDCKGKFSVSQFSIKNLEFRVHMDQGNMYPTETAVNLQNVSRVNIADSQFCLNETVGDALQHKELQPNPCHTAGLVLSGDQNDDNVLRNVAVQGFRYGIVAGEHVVADYLYIHNCEEGITFHDCSHLSTFGHIVAQHNRMIITTTRERLFGMDKGPCYVIVHALDCEDGIGTKPLVSQLYQGVYDPENRLCGSLLWHMGYGGNSFPTQCAETFAVKKL
jgi:hypothetical protein